MAIVSHPQFMRKGSTKCGPWISSIHTTGFGACQKSKFSGSLQDLLDQKLWRQGPEIWFLTSPPGDSSVCLSLRPPVFRPPDLVSQVTIVYAAQKLLNVQSPDLPDHNNTPAAQCNFEGAGFFCVFFFVFKLPVLFGIEK